MSIITLTTDFGLKDGNVGVMKGVIWGIAPRARVVDISHLIAPQNVSEAALILLRSAPHFPPGTVHLVVVDPGVGTARRPMAAQVGPYYYVGPDNGTLTLLLERAGQIGWPVSCVQLERRQYWRPEISQVFHGRDIFAPVAAHLANGVALAGLGTPFDDPVLLDLPSPQRSAQGWRGEVIHVDHFGNISTNLRVEHLGQPASLRVRLGEVEIEGLVQTFGERPPGSLVALFGSTGNLIVSVVNGNAAERLGVQPGSRWK
jgi:S-adenosylmethionine hydrolase